MVSRSGAERFTAAAESNQRRYEALRAYFVEGQSARAVAEHFGYTRSTVETLVGDWRAGRLGLFASSRPGPRRQPNKDRARTLALALRREGRSLREIERALRAEWVPLSRTAIWELAEEAGLGRDAKPQTNRCRSSLPTLADGARPSSTDSRPWRTAGRVPVQPSSSTSRNSPACSEKLHCGSPSRGHTRCTGLRSISVQGDSPEPSVFRGRIGPCSPQLLRDLLKS